GVAQGSARLRRLGAGRAGAEDLDGVSDVAEAVLVADRLGPALHHRALHLDGVTAAAADQVVVVLTGLARAVDGLALVVAAHVDLTPVGQRVQRPVDRGQPELRAVLAHLRVDVLGAAEPLTLTQYFVDGSSPGSHVTSSTRILPASLTFDSWYRPRRMNLPTPRESTKPASASRTMAAPGGTLVEAVEASSPPTAATVPNSIASRIVVRNPRVRCWLVAPGITMSALTSSSPTTRMAITTASAAVTAISMLRKRTGSPLALAIS